MTPYRSLTPQEIDDIAKEAARGNGTLDIMLSQAMFGGRPPRHWRDWPKEAMETWDAAVSLWSYYTRGRWMNRASPVSLDAAWMAVNESAELEPDDRYSWPDLASRLHTLPRKVEYQLVGRLQFGFTGRPPNRRLVRGPCLYCGQVKDAKILSAGVCDVCLKDYATPDDQPGLIRGEFDPRHNAQARGEYPDTRVRTKIVAVRQTGRVTVHSVTHVHRKLG